MRIKFNENDIQMNIDKTKELSSIFNGKEVYVKSIISSINETTLDEEYTNYHKYKISDIQFGPSFLYIYGIEGKDKIILRLKDITEIETKFNSLRIVRNTPGFHQEFEISLI